MRRKLLHFRSLLSHNALRTISRTPKPKPQPHHVLHSPITTTTNSSSHLLWRPATTATCSSLLPKTAAAAAMAVAARTAAERWLAGRGARLLDLFSLQRRRASASLFSSSFLRGSSWAYWMETADGVVWLLIGANVAVFLLWRIADPWFMRKHFMISLDNFRSGRLHTMLTSAFSHAELDHLLTNMIGLYFFGTSIANLFGPSFLLKLYVAGALSGSIFFLLEKALLTPRKQVYVGWDNSRAPALGASAAVNAIILLEVFLYPKRLVYLYFLFPVPAAFVGALLIGADLWRIKKGQGHVSGSAHLGGALVAAFVWARIRKGWI